MTIDERLTAAQTDLTTPPTGVHDAKTFVRHRVRRRYAAVGAAVSVALVAIGVGVIARDDARRDDVVAVSPQELNADVEGRLLTGEDAGPGWAVTDQQPTPASEESCGISDIKDVELPIVSATRVLGRFQVPDFSLLGERISRYADESRAEDALAAIRRAFEGCTTFVNRAPNGDTTRGTMQPLDVTASSAGVWAMSGTLHVTSAAGAESTETGYWVAVQRGPYVAILFGIDFGGEPTSRSAVEALTGKASARLAP